MESKANSPLFEKTKDGKKSQSKPYYYNLKTNKIWHYKH